MSSCLTTSLDATHVGCFLAPEPTLSYNHTSAVTILSFPPCLALIPPSSLCSSLTSSKKSSLTSPFSCNTSLPWFYQRVPHTTIPSIPLNYWFPHIEEIGALFLILVIIGPMGKDFPYTSQHCCSMLCTVLSLRQTPRTHRRWAGKSREAPEKKAAMVALRRPEGEHQELPSLAGAWQEPCLSLRVHLPCKSVDTLWGGFRNSSRRATDIPGSVMWGGIGASPLTSWQNVPWGGRFVEDSMELERKGVILMASPSALCHAP